MNSKYEGFFIEHPTTIDKHDKNNYVYVSLFLEGRINMVVSKTFFI